jgi:hypothetical protein
VLDPRSGRVMNANLADYHVPVNADVPSLEAILVEESDPYVNELGIKGVGEIGITGHGGSDCQCCVARNGSSRSPLSDHYRAADRSGSGLGKPTCPAGNRDPRSSHVMLGSSREKLASSIRCFRAAAHRLEPSGLQTLSGR